MVYHGYGDHQMASLKIFSNKTKAATYAEELNKSISHGYVTTMKQWLY
jgi:hypothetical protein